MAVVINEMDVVPAESRLPAVTEPEKGGGASEPPSPDEINRLLDEEASRCQRVWAY